MVTKTHRIEPRGRTALPVLALLVAMVLSLGAAARTARAQSDDFQLLDRIVAVVNDGVVLQSDLDQETAKIIGQLRAQNRPLPDADTLHRQVLERLIIRTVQVQRARSLGLQIDDTSLNRAVEEIAQNNRMSLEQFRQALIREGYDYRQFREDIRTELLVNQLRRREVTSRINVSEQEIENQIERLERDRQVEYHVRQIFLSLPGDADPERVAEVQRRAAAIIAEARGGADFAALAARESEGERALEGGDLGWRKPSQLPGMFADALEGLDSGAISDAVRSPIGLHILQLAEIRGEDKYIVRQTRARHILLRVTPVRNDQQARTQLQDLLHRIEQGDDFADLARTHSDDGASASQGGELPWFSNGMMDPEFEETAQNLAVGEISAPFRSSFGWHIVQVLERRDADNTEEFKRSQARRIIRQRKAEVETETWLRRLRDEAFVDLRQDPA